MTKLRFAFDRPADFLPRFVKTAELAQCVAEVAPCSAFTRRIASHNILFCRLAVEGHGVFIAAEDIAVQVPQLP